MPDGLETENYIALTHCSGYKHSKYVATDLGLNYAELWIPFSDCCVCVFSRYCGVPNPSWYEISHFVRFLNFQLHSSETSHFLKKTVTGLKTFVVKFLVRMSKVIMNMCLCGPTPCNSITRGTK